MLFYSIIISLNNTFKTKGNKHFDIVQYCVNEQITKNFPEVLFFPPHILPEII